MRGLFVDLLRLDQIEYEEDPILTPCAWNESKMHIRNQLRPNTIREETSRHNLVEGFAKHRHQRNQTKIIFV